MGSSLRHSKTAVSSQKINTIQYIHMFMSWISRDAMLEEAVIIRNSDFCPPVRVVAFVTAYVYAFVFVFFFFVDMKNICKGGLYGVYCKLHNIRWRQ